MSEDQITRQEYNEQIGLLAEQVAREVEEEGRELAEAVWESVDSHQWIIYTSYHLSVLELAEHEPDEWKHLVGDGDSWRDVIQAMAYSAMEQDVYFRAQEQIEN